MDSVTRQMMIELDRLTIGYGDREIISGAAASFGASTLTALIGRNGTGKSTLLRTITGLMRPTKGSVMVDGLDVSRTGSRRLARTLAFVSTRRIKVPKLRCYDAVAAARSPYTGWTGALTAEDRHIVDEALARVGMEDFAGRFLDTLSDGEHQRVMIARALAQQTPVILLDEPTSFLDIPNRIWICSLLAELSHELGKCVLFSTHELDIAVKYADALALICDRGLRVDKPATMQADGWLARTFYD